MKNEIRSWALIFINFRGGSKTNYKMPKLIKKNEEKQAGPNPDLNATEGSLGGAWEELNLTAASPCTQERDLKNEFV